MPDTALRDPAFGGVLRAAERAARSQAAVLVSGESGTGKTRLARLIHSWSARSAGPFVEVPCANLSPGTAESDLFGHEQGAFTDAHAARAGRFELANGGTLFLDELQELLPEIQAKVLRAVEDKRFERLGGRSTVEVDVRIVASTRERPERLVRAGILREDLFYRLNVVHLALPPLRDRPSDLTPLVDALLEEIAAHHGTRRFRLDPDALDRLRAYDWPGNVRELRHVLESAMVLAGGDVIAAADLPPSLSVGRSAVLRGFAAEERSLADVERAYIDEVLRRTRGNKSAAARILGIHRKTLHEKLRSRGEDPSS